MARRKVSVFGIAAFGLAAFAGGGCSSLGEGASGEQDLTPAMPETIEEQRALCVDRVKENGAFRQRDLELGVVRWKCGDVTGVNGADLGQEYCEFHAYQDGVLADRMAPSRVRANKVECLFTGVFKDVRPEGPEAEAYGLRLNEQVSDGPNNLMNAAGKRNAITVMSGPFNSRIAATILLKDCAETTQYTAELINAASDEVVCSADGAGCYTQKDVEACITIAGNGVGWRNSDPIICGRAARATMCGAKMGALPDALDGFFITDWEADLGKAVAMFTGRGTEPPSLPERCRYATIDGKPYLQLVICRPTAQDVDRYKNGPGLQQLCSDVFGPKLSMSAPLGLVTEPGHDDEPFCKQFHDGVRKLKSLAFPEAATDQPPAEEPSPEPSQPGEGT